MEVVGMEADIYPRQCVTGSAKSAMMNVLAGINPQCTPPLPSSSAVPPPPLLLLPCRFLPSPHHLSHPLTSLVLIHFRNTSLSPFLPFLPFSFLPVICSLFVSASPPPPPPLSFLASLLPLRASPCISFGFFLYRASLYRAPARYCPVFYTYTRDAMPRIYFYDTRSNGVWE